MKKYLGFFTFCAVLPMSFNVKATGFDGAKVTRTIYCCSAPIESDRISVPLTKTVDSGTEFPAGSIQGPSLISNIVDIGTFTIDYDYTSNQTAGTGAFNGDVLDFFGTNLPEIVGVSLNPLSTFATSSIGLSFDADTVRINAAGLSFTPDSRILVDVVFAPVPEPEIYAMLLAGLGLMGFMARRRKQF